MKSRSVRVLLAPMVLLVLAMPLLADTAPETLAPLHVVPGEDDTVLRLSVDSEALTRLETLNRVRLSDVPLPDGERVSLNLARVHVSRSESLLYVDGKPAGVGDLEEGLSMWSGKIAGKEGSDVFLAFSRHGSRGWIHGDARVNLLAGPGPDGDWTDSRAWMVTDEWAHENGLETSPVCGTGPLLEEWRPYPRPVSGRQASSHDFLPLYDCSVPVETDDQYFEVFGDLDAARTYAVSIFGAVSLRYREQVGTILTLPYLGLYTAGNDPWMTQEMGGDCVDLIYEFQAAWREGGAPVYGDLYHFLSGAQLICGAGFIDALCSQERGFSVSCCITGQSPFPTIPSHPLNQDFYLMAHELGHNFGSVHTHEYCPPLDECAIPAVWGPCQDETFCPPEGGTIMSYCHGCGGFEDITTYLHPEVASLMRGHVEASCLPLFRGVEGTDIGFALEGSNGVPSMELSFTRDPDVFHVTVEGAPLNEEGGLIVSFSLALTPFHGGILVPEIRRFRRITSGMAGSVNLGIPIGLNRHFPGGALGWAQAWFRDPEGPNDFAATNGVEFEIILP